MENKKIGTLSLCMAIAGAVAPISLALVMLVLEKLGVAPMPYILPFILFVGLEITALVIGIVGRASVYGKAGIAVSAALLALAAVVFSFTTVHKVERQEVSPTTTQQFL